MQKAFFLLILVFILFFIFGCVINEENQLDLKNDDVNIIEQKIVLENLIEINEFDLPGQWIIFREEELVEKSIEVSYSNNMLDNINLVGFTHSKLCGSGRTYAGYWLQVWFVYGEEPNIVEREFKRGNNMREILNLDVDLNIQKNDFVGLVIVDVMKNFEKTIFLKE
jgi:hypothetical protein